MCSALHDCSEKTQSFVFFKLFQKHSEGSVGKNIKDFNNNHNATRKKNVQKQIQYMTTVWGNCTGRQPMLQKAIIS